MNKPGWLRTLNTKREARSDSEYINHKKTVLRQFLDDLSNLLTVVETKQQQEITHLNNVEDKADQALEWIKNSDRGVVFIDEEEMWLNFRNPENEGKWHVGESVFLVDENVPDYWIRNVYRGAPGPAGYYYDVIPVETKPIDISDLTNVKKYVLRAICNEEYSIDGVYNVGDYVRNDFVLYECTSQTTGLWDYTSWKEVSLTDLVKKLTFGLDSAVIEEDIEEGIIRNKWDFFGTQKDELVGENGSFAEGTMIVVEGLIVDARNGKWDCKNRIDGYVQVNAGTIIQIPLLSKSKVRVAMYDAGTCIKVDGVIGGGSAGQESVFNVSGNNGVAVLTVESNSCLMSIIVERESLSYVREWNFDGGYTDQYSEGLGIHDIDGIRVSVLEDGYLDLTSNGLEVTTGTKMEVNVQGRTRVTVRAGMGEYTVDGVLTTRGITDIFVVEGYSNLCEIEALSTVIFYGIKVESLGAEQNSEQVYGLDADTIGGSITAEDVQSFMLANSRNESSVTKFNDDGSITTEYSGGIKEITTFDEDGQINTTLVGSNGEVLNEKTTVLTEEGSVITVVKEGE